MMSKLKKSIEKNSITLIYLNSLPSFANCANSGKKITKSFTKYNAK